MARSNLLGRAACDYHGQASSALGGLRLTVPPTLKCHSYWDAPPLTPVPRSSPPPPPRKWAARWRDEQDRGEPCGSPRLVVYVNRWRGWAVEMLRCAQHDGVGRRFPGPQSRVAAHAASGANTEAPAVACARRVTNIVGSVGCVLAASLVGVAGVRAHVAGVVLAHVTADAGAVAYVSGV